ncbi:MAG: 6-phosphogluconolactonase, partial [Halothiobacillaceae bacterium]
MHAELYVHPGPETLAAAVARRWAALAEAAIAEHGRFTVALSGGRTPRILYELLASPAWRDRLPWDRTELYLGDERCVPADHPDSNARMVREALLDRLP